ncbi:MAG: hypothetical protein LBE02_08555 [Spirochaetaceae bacterium]|jgi:hypothetical protein|nr:hypothetical protein [Spirochaetaceae bacterium]
MALYNTIIKFIVLHICLLTFSFPLFSADVAVASIEDDSALRVSIRDSWLTKNLSEVLRNRSFIHTLPGGISVQVRAERRDNEVLVILARERNGVYTGWAQGSWIYFRNLNTGAPERIRIFLRSDPMAYVQFRPLGNDKTQLDVVVQGAYIVRGLPLGLPFNRLLSLPVEEVLAAAGGRFPRRYFDPDPQMYRDVRAFVGKVRSALPSLTFRDDGVLDENNRYVFIETLEGQTGTPGLNCSGFAKWIVDGVLRPVTGRRLDIGALKVPASPRTSSLAANYEDQDALFGLDWTRNLALEAARALRSPSFATLENVEVRQGTFAALVDRRGERAAVRNYPAFLLNAGFSIEGLQPLLYTLAVNEPGYLYLAAVSRERASALPLRQYYHVAVLVPYFSEYGVFQVAVFESAEETNLAGFIGRHPRGMVNLVRIPVEGIFDP